MIQATLNTFNGIAPIYDKLARFVFGKSMYEAQTLFLREIEPSAKVLIVGGGTGWLMAELLNINVTCKIWYIEASSKMLELSKKTIAKSSHAVYFIHGTEAAIPSDIIFDAVVTHFYLDLFPTETCNGVIQKIKSSINKKSIWLITDFINETWWHHGMTRVMYKFFGITCKMKVSQLPAWRRLLNENGFVEKRHQNFFGKFIRSSLFLQG